MKKNVLRFSALLMLVSFGLFAQPAHITKGRQKIECEILPIKPLSKSHLTNYAGTRILNPRMSSNRAQSLNWSGYASYTNASHPTVGSVTGVLGTWNVPKLQASVSDQYSACWVGIDGYFSSTVEQIGTAQFWQGGKQVNYVWFSMYPGPTYEITGFPISANDEFEAAVTRNGNAFQMIIENITRGVYYQVPLRYTTAPGAMRTSAEWIVEAPSEATILPLAHFSPVTFKNCSAQIQGRSGAINSNYWKSDQLTMVTGSTPEVVKASPSGLTNNGQNFIVTWNHQ